MALKPRYKRRILWTVISAIGLLAVAIVLVPPLITLNYMKPKIEAAITAQTGVTAKINGNVHFSLLGHATIVAHDVVIPMGTINSAVFRVPLSSILDAGNTSLTGNIVVYGANLHIERLEPQSFNYNIEIKNSQIMFMGKPYYILNGTVFDGKFTGLVRTDDHKYEIEFQGDAFHVRNRDNALNLTGYLFSDGAARGKIALATDDINRWFEFDTPRIDRPIQMTANFEWDGANGVKFQDIHANSFTGNIDLNGDGSRRVQLASKNMDFDFSFLLKPNDVLYRTAFDLDFYGNMKLGSKKIHHLKVLANGARDKIQIREIVADDTTISGGYIDANGAHNIMIRTPFDGVTVTCLFSGTPDKWHCGEFSYNHITGQISVDGDKFNIYVQSPKNIPGDDEIRRMALRFGKHGTVEFKFNDAAGRMEISEKEMSREYTFARNRSLEWFGGDIKFMPEFMRRATGDFTWSGDKMHFKPKSEQWILTVQGGKFTIRGKNAKQWLPGIDLQALNDLPYEISGTYAGDAIDNLNIIIAGQEFSGTATAGAITLKTNLLDMDAFTNQSFVDNFEELEFTTMHPLMIPFDVGTNISISAAHVIYNGNEYSNFVYSMRGNTQTFSITDDARGGILMTVRRDKNKYDISAALSRFKIAGFLLNNVMPLNVSDTLITGEIEITTFGKVAHDILYNMAGEIDTTFDGGMITGIGVDGFYQSAENITKLNAEYALSAALTSGETALKSMRVIGHYENGNFETTRPLEISMRHSTATGQMQIIDGRMSANLKIVMRGVAPAPSPIELQINPNGTRNYSLSQIMMDLDTGYMREFVKTHAKF